MDQLASLFIKLSLQSDSFLSQLKQLSSKTLPMAQNIGKSIIRGVGRVLKAGFKAVAITSLGILAATFAGGIKSLNIASEFETEFSKVRAVLGSTDNEANKLRRSLIDLGLNEQFKISTLEAADTALVLAKNGLSAAEIMGGALEASTALANATTQEFGKSADVATDLIKIFGLENEQLASSVDLAVGAINQSKFGLNDYRLALGQSGQVASTFGVSIEDFNTVIAGTANAFTSGSDAGTSFKVFLQRTVPQTDRAAVAMKRLGLQTVNQANLQKELNIALGTAGPAAMKRYEKALEGGKSGQEVLRAVMGTTKAEFLKFSQEVNVLDSAFFDANGEMKDMQEISVALSEGLRKLGSDELRASFLTDAFGMDAIRTATALAKMSDAIGDDAAILRYAKSIGMTSDELEHLGKLETPAMLSELQESLGLSDEKFRELGMSTGFLSTEWDSLVENISNTSAFDNAAIQVDNLSGSFEILKDQVTQFGVSFGSAIAPAFKFLNKLGSAVLETFMGQFTTVGEGARMLTTQLFGDLEGELKTDGLGSVLSTLGLDQFINPDLIGDMAGFRDRLTNVAQNVVDIFGSFNDREMDASAFDKLMLALNQSGEFKVAARMRELKAAFEDFRDGNFTGMLSNLGFDDDQIGHIKSIQESLESIGTSLVEAFTFDASTDLTFLEAVDGFLKYIVDNEESLKGWAETLLKLGAGFAAIAVIMPIVNALMLAYSAIMWIASFASWAVVFPILRVVAAFALIVAIVALIGYLLHLLGVDFGEVQDAINEFWDNTKVGAEVLWEWLKLHFNKISEEWSKAWEGMKEYWNNDIVPWWNGVTETAGKVSAIIAFLFIFFAAVFKIAWDGMISYWHETVVPWWNDVTTTAKKVKAIVSLAFHAMWTKFLLSWSRIKNYWTNTVKPMFKSWVKWFTVDIPDAIEEAKQAVIERLQEMLTKFISLGEGIQGVIDKFWALVAAVKTRVTMSVGISHLTEDSESNSPMVIHTRAMEFADYLKNTDFSLTVGSQAGSAFDSVNQAMTDTTSNIQTMTNDLDNALSDRQFGVQVNASDSLGLEGAEGLINSARANLAGLRAEMAETVLGINASVSTATGDTIQNVFQDGAVSIGLDTTEVDDQDDFAEFLAGRIVGNA